MRLLDIFNRHPRDDISAHADGELAPARLDTLEAHLTGCQRCRTELDGLLTVRDALRDLPQVAAPRSFTLTPAMTEREPAPVTSRTTPSFVAMRVAGAGFAAVLAVVVMLDAGGIVDDNGGRSSDESPTALFEADQTNRDAQATAGTDEYEFGPLSNVLDDATGGLATTPPLDDDNGVPAAGSVGGVGGGPDASSEDAPDGDDVDPAFGALSDGIEQDLRAAPTTAGNRNEIAGAYGEAGVPDAGDGAAAAFTSEDDSVSYLLVIEISLAAIAVLAIGGSFVMRRRVESE